MSLVGSRRVRGKKVSVESLKVKVKKVSVVDRGPQPVTSKKGIIAAGLRSRLVVDRKRLDELRAREDALRLDRFQGLGAACSLGMHV